MQNVQNMNLISTQFPDKKNWWKTDIDSLFPKKTVVQMFQDLTSKQYLESK